MSMLGKVDLRKEDELDFSARFWALRNPGLSCLWVFKTPSLARSYFSREADSMPHGAAAYLHRMQIVYPNSARVRIGVLEQSCDTDLYAGLLYSHLQVDSSVEDDLELREAVKLLRNRARASASAW